MRPTRALAWALRCGTIDRWAAMAQTELGMYADAERLAWRSLARLTDGGVGTDDEYALYEKIYSHLKPQVPVPDLVIYLQAPVPVLVDRVQRRGSDYERTIEESYLARVADTYTRFFYRYDGAPLIIVNSERLNFVDDPGHFALLLERIASMRGRREFFNLGQSA